MILPCILFYLVAMPAQAGKQADPAQRMDRIAFASCAKPNQPEAIWRSILAQEPDLFLFIGDNVYVDQPRRPKGVEDFERTYAQLASEPGWQKIKTRVPILATWDDHDYGLNDAGKEFALKKIAQEQFIKFYELPADSPVREREGVYDAHVFGPEGQRVQVILLDTRTFRDPLNRNPNGRVKGLGPYIAHTETDSTLLGEAQWAWLEKQLEQPAELRIIASSIQVIADEHGWETWGNFPHERDRLFKLIDKKNARGVVFISGDRHVTEISCDKGPGTPYAMWDFTSSGMNEGGNRLISEPNTHRVGESRRTANYGLFTIDWKTKTLTCTTRGKQGEVILQQAVAFEELKADAR
jgi:alkaline phosphatase D